MIDPQQFEQSLGYVFQNRDLLTLALTHPSVAHETGQTGVSAQHNQRLEFLGDAVLGLILTQELYAKFPDLGEGPLTKARAEMVNRRSLAQQARRLKLGDALILSRGEDLNGGRARASALADAFEAVIGAVFVDGGFEKAKVFVLAQFHPCFGELRAIPSIDNPKGELQEILQADQSDPPCYTVASTAGPDHDRVFECIVTHHGNELGRGHGKSKKEAESSAAMAALDILRKA